MILLRYHELDGLPRVSLRWDRQLHDVRMSPPIHSIPIAMVSLQSERQLLQLLGGVCVPYVQLDGQAPSWDRLRG